MHANPLQLQHISADSGSDVRLGFGDGTTVRAGMFLSMQLATGAFIKHLQGEMR